MNAVNTMNVTDMNVANRGARATASVAAMIMGVVGVLSLAACGGGGSVSPLPSEPPVAGPVAQPAPVVQPEPVGQPEPVTGTTPGVIGDQPVSLGEAARDAALAGVRFGSFYQSNDGDVKISWTNLNSYSSAVFYLIDYNPEGAVRDITAVPVPPYDRTCPAGSPPQYNGCVSIQTEDYLLEVLHYWMLLGRNAARYTQGHWVDVERKKVGVFIDGGIPILGPIDPTTGTHRGRTLSTDNMTFTRPGDFAWALMPTRGGYVWEQASNLRYGSATGKVTINLTNDLASGGDEADRSWYVSGSLSDVALEADQTGSVPGHKLAGESYALDRTEVITTEDVLERWLFSDGVIEGGSERASGTYGGEISYNYTGAGRPCGSEGELPCTYYVILGTLGLTDIEAHDGLSVLMSYQLVSPLDE